jgi:hypothetical protein
MSWLFSQALVEEYSAGTSLAGAPCAQLSVMPTQHRFWRNDKPMDASDLSQFGLTSQLLTAGHGMELLMSYLAAFHAKTSAPPAPARVSAENAAACGPTWRASFARYSPDSSTWKTAQCSLLGDWDEFSETWPRWGSMRNGVSFLRPIPALPICASESGLWPTPTVCGNNNQPGASKTAGWGLSSAAKQWTTPSASDARRGGTITAAMSGSSLAQQVNTPAFWPTPTASLGTKGGRVTPRKGREGGTLIEAVSARTWPTPNASDATKWSNQTLVDRVLKGQQVRLNTAVSPEGGKGGQLNPAWVEWLMGWPTGWTELKPLETAKFHEWQQQHGGF